MRAAAHYLQDELMPRYAELVYNGFWFSPERRALQAAIDETQKFCTGTVRLKLYKVRRFRFSTGCRPSCISWCVIACGLLP